MRIQSHALPLGILLVMYGLSGPVQALAVVPNFNIAGIPPPGFAHFDQTRDVEVKLVKSGTGTGATYQLTATFNNTANGDPALFQQDPWTQFGMSGTYQLTANFDSAAGWTGGSVSINGTVPGYNVPGYTAPPNTSSLLYRADLIAYRADTTADATPMALGFETTNPTGWAAQFQTGNESVYLYDFNVAALMGSFTSNKFKSVTFTKASALTTVPLPAAFWLFGTALLALSGARRRPALPARFEDWQ